LAGLVDSESEEDFFAKLASLQTKWDEMEKPFLLANEKPSFFSYIYDKVNPV